MLELLPPAGDSGENADAIETVARGQCVGDAGLVAGSDDLSGDGEPVGRAEVRTELQPVSLGRFSDPTERHVRKRQNRVPTSHRCL